MKVYGEKVIKTPSCQTFDDNQNQTDVLQLFFIILQID